MADITAHVPTGPESTPLDAERPLTAPPDAATGTPIPESAAVHDAITGEAGSTEVAVVGRTNSPAAGAGSDLPVWSFRDDGSHTERGPSAPTDRHQAELPFMPSTVITPPPRTHPMFGPVGRPRSPLLVAVLAAVTLGVSALVWHRRVNRELEEFDPKLHVRPVRSAVAVAVPWLVGLLTTLAGATFIIGGRLSIHVPLGSHVGTAAAYSLLAGLAAVPYLVVLVPFSLMAIAMTAERLRCVEEHTGTTTDRQLRPVGSSLLLLIPIVGGLVLVSTEQRRLNAIWDAMAPTGHIVR
ncbi:MAG: hypothetical protein ACRENL_06650 [Candidatus Dormibacteria bacterium]